MKRAGAVFLMLLFFMLALPGSAATAEAAPDPDMVRGRVVRVIREEGVSRAYVEGQTIRQELLVEVTSGAHAGERFIVVNEGTGNPVYEFFPRQGEKILLALEENPDGTTNAHLADRLREPVVYTLAILFAVVVLLVGGLKGLKALISLVSIVALVSMVMLPRLLRGGDPIWNTAAVAVASTLITLGMVGGPNRKTLSALGGVAGGIAVAGALASLAGRWAHLTGFSAEESVLLLYLPNGSNFDVQGLLFAGIMLGSLGAIMDMGMSVASAVGEVRQANPGYSVQELFRAGMNVGRDTMGTMANTLILAYTGSSIPLLMILLTYKHSYLKMLNFDFIASECVRAFSGTIGMILAIPLTALLGAVLLGSRNRKESTDDSLDRGGTLI